MNLCIVIQGPSLEEARQQITSATPLADILELRIDLLDEYSINAIKMLKDQTSLPMIFTIRKQSQGGAFKGSEKERLALIQQAAALRPMWFDLEFDTPPKFVQEIRELTKVILSFHDFSGTPAHLALPDTPADAYKIATYAHNALDALILLRFLKEHSKTHTLSVMGMGESGDITRILGKIFGSHLVYASLNDSLATAPGQISAKVLKEVYHWDTLNKETQIFGLIGDPVNQSISQFTHNQTMQRLELPSVYVKVRVMSSELTQAVKEMFTLGWKGISVTMPHKESILTELDQIDLEAKKIGAVNTLYKLDGKVAGKNTDGIGALNAIREQLDPKGKTVVVLGAGGAAKAIIHELARAGADLIILNRTVEKGEAIAAKYGAQAVSSIEGIPYDLVINTTPVDVDIPWIPGKYVMDIRIRPKWTPFLKEAEKNECKVIFGYKMFLYQAVEQFKTWFPFLNKEKIKVIIENESISAIDSF